MKKESSCGVQRYTQPLYLLNFKWDECKVFMQSSFNIAEGFLMKKIFVLLILFLVVMSGLATTLAETEYNELPLEDTAYLLENEYIWYRFWFTKGQMIEATLEVPSTADVDLYFQSDNTLDDSNNDGYIDDDGEPDLLAISNDYGYGVDERIEWECPTTNEYFVIVHAFEGDGAYTLRVRETGGGGGSGLLIGVGVGIIILIAVLVVIFLRIRKGKTDTRLPPTLTTTSKTPVEGIRYCTVCGSGNTGDSMYCASCGARLS